MTRRLSLALLGLAGISVLGSLLVGTQLVRVSGLNANDLASRLGFLRMAYILVSGVVATAALVAWALLVRPLKDRLAAIRRVADSLAEGRIQAPIGDQADDEVGEVARSLDRLAEAITVDLRTRQTSEDELRRKASFDELTGAANRASLTVELENTLADKEMADHAALLSIDLDRFKELNDTFGHQAGDEALKIVTERIKAAVKASDVVARMGGDEFLVLLRNVSPVEVAEVVARLRASMGRDATIGNKRHKLLFSIGTTQIGYGVDAEFLLREVDIAMYQDKERNRRLREQARVNSSDEVVDVLGDGHLDIRFQPIFHIGNGQVVGAMVMPYWLNTTGGVLEPSQFRAMIDDTPQGVAFDQAAIGQMLAHVHALAYNHVLPANFVIVMKPTLATLGESSFPAWLQSVMAKRGLPPSMLQMTISRSSVENDPAGIRELHRIGVKMAVEDLGILAMQDDRVGQLQMTLGMIGQRRLRDLARNKLARPAIMSLLSLASQANLVVVADGVDEERDFAELGPLGIGFAAGDYLARTMNVDDLRRGLSAQQQATQNKAA